VKSKASITAALCVGFLIGATTAGLFHVVRGRNLHATLEQKLRCKDLTENYVKKYSIERATLNVDRFDFSPSQNTCVASVSKTSGNHESYQVVDVVLEKMLFTGSCDGDENSREYCDNGRASMLLQQQDEAFQKAVKGSWF
jgi:hypothetical protein